MDRVEEIAREIVGASRMDWTRRNEPSPTLESRIAAALRQERVKALEEAAKVTEAHGKRMFCWCCTEAAEKIRSLALADTGVRG